MQLVGRSGGYWLFWGSAAYLVIGLYCALFYKDIRTEFIQILWLSFLALPFTYPPLGRWLNMDIKWDKNMFDWFGKKDNNVIEFPRNYSPQAEYVPPAPKAKEPKTYYTFGLTDDNRMTFTMGYTTLTMNHAGVQQLIDQLEFFKDQLEVKSSEEE